MVNKQLRAFKALQDDFHDVIVDGLQSEIQEVMPDVLQNAFDLGVSSATDALSSPPMEHLHCITVKYIGATNSRGSRIKLSSSRFSDSVTLAREYIHSNSREQAIEWLLNHQYKVVSYGEAAANMDVLMCRKFEALSYHK